MSTKWNQTDVEKGSYGFNVRAATAASAGAHGGGHGSMLTAASALPLR
jgi:hypothetical protein